MLPIAKAISPPSDDKRWKIVDGMMRRHGHEPFALIEVLHTVQETFGFLTDDGLRYVAASCVCLTARFTESPRSTISSP